MTKSQIERSLQRALVSFSDLQYAYIAGSFNTPLFGENSDIDLVLVWTLPPTLEVRQHVLQVISKMVKNSTMWSFLDETSLNARDAIKLEGFRKIEVYHHGVDGFQILLEQISEHDGLEFSLKNAVRLIDKSEFSLFVQSYIGTTDLKEQTFVAVMSRFSASEETSVLDDVLKLYTLFRLGGIPSAKHRQKYIVEVPEVQLLGSDRFQWLKKYSSLIQRWVQRAPSIKIEVSNSTQLIKSSSQHNEYVFSRVQEQKERLSKYLSWPKNINSMADQNRFSETALQQWDEGKAFHYQIFKDQIFAGGISIHSFNPEQRSYQFGYWIDQNFEGHGLIHRSIQALVEEMSSLGWKRPLIRVHEANLRSVKVAERLGLKTVIIK